MARDYRRRAELPDPAEGAARPDRPSPAGVLPRLGKPSAPPTTFRKGDAVPTWLFQVAPVGCYARFLQATRVTPVEGADHEFVVEAADPDAVGHLVEVVSDGRPAQMRAAGRGVRVEGRAQLTRGAASHLNRRTRRLQAAEMRRNRP
jgi:hypothetical protein